MRLNYISKNNDVFLLIISRSNHNGFEVYLDREKRYQTVFQRSLARSRFVFSNGATAKWRAYEQCLPRTEKKTMNDHRTEIHYSIRVVCIDRMAIYEIRAQ